MRGMSYTLTNRENALAILRYQHYERMPIVAFAYWKETVKKWASEGHITTQEAEDYIKTRDNGDGDKSIMRKLGFDFNWFSVVGAQVDLFPAFEPEVLETRPDGSRIVRDSAGLIVLEKPGTVSIPSEIGTTLIDRKSWEEHYLPRLQWDSKRINFESMKALADDSARQQPLGLHCGSLIGTMRNLLGVEQLSYLYCDDEELYLEVVDTLAGLSYNCVKTMLETGAKFDFAHYWEDICFKNGPLVTPDMFREVVGPYYKKTTDLLSKYNIDIVSVDCDGWIDSLIPTWLENGVNTMFPIEVGTWEASIKPWREKYGKQIRGVGGMNKTVFSMDYKAIDAEIERLRPLIELGGYIPCPDHRIAPDAKFSNVQYYCERLRRVT